MNSTNTDPQAVTSSGRSGLVTSRNTSPPTASSASRVLAALVRSTPVQAKASEMAIERVSVRARPICESQLVQPKPRPVDSETATKVVRATTAATAVRQPSTATRCGRDSRTSCAATGNPAAAITASPACCLSAIASPITIGASTSEAETRGTRCTLSQMANTTTPAIRVSLWAPPTRWTIAIGLSTPSQTAHCRSTRS